MEDSLPEDGTHDTATRNVISDSARMPGSNEDVIEL